jgi:hypothetical protein
MCWPVSRQSRFSFIFFLQQEPEPEPEPRARIRFRFRFFLGQNDTVPAVPVPAPVPQHCFMVMPYTSRIFVFSTCRQPGCEAGIRNDSFEPVQCGAGLKLKAVCNMGHRTSFSTCEFFNNSRTSVLDVKISVLQLVIGLSMTQVCKRIKF